MPAYPDGYKPKSSKKPAKFVNPGSRAWQDAAERAYKRDGLRAQREARRAARITKRGRGVY